MNFRVLNLADYLFEKFCEWSVLANFADFRRRGQKRKSAINVSHCKSFFPYKVRLLRKERFSSKTCRIKNTFCDQIKLSIEIYQLSFFLFFFLASDI